MSTLIKPPPPAPVRAAVTPSPVRKHWQEVLRDCGYPTGVLVVDFETFFDDGFGMGGGHGLSTIEYVTDPRFEVLTCAFTLIQQPHAEPAAHTRCLVGEDAIREYLKYLRGQFGGKLTVVSQNAAFDMTILARRFGVYPAYLIDLLGLARHQNARQRNDLGTLCKQHGLIDKGQTADFKGLSFRTRYRKPKGRGPKMPVQVAPITNEQLDKLIEYNTSDNLREWELFEILLPRLSNPRVELRLIQHTIELFTKPTLRVDFEKGRALVERMNARIDAALPVNMTRETISGNNTFESHLTTAIEQAGDNPLAYTKFGKRGAMLALAKTDDEREKLLEHPDPAVKGLMQARVAVKSWPLHIARIERIMAQAKADGGRLPVPLKYHGAHTGRAAGGEKINLQNLGSRGDPLIAEVREMIVAPPDHELVIADAAAIEARVLAWIAGQWDLVEKFRQNADVYCEFAAKILGHPVKHHKYCLIPAIKARMKWARDSVGKIGILGCGYGMGADKTCGYAKGAITLDIAQKIVQTYRAENREIVKFWYALEKAFLYTATYHKPCAMDRGLSFRRDPDCDVVIVLPNGRELHYSKVRVTPDGPEVYNALEHHWERTWGGTLTENVVQAISRDVLMEAMLRLEDVGCHTALHVHDELVLVTPAGKGEEVKELAIAELSREPDWAPRMALSAEGCVSDCYGKH